MCALLVLIVLANPDLGQLRELLQDRQDPRGQSQAALLLLQERGPAAEKFVRQTLRKAENEEAFLALAAAVRMRQDDRFTGELLAALIANRPRLRQAVAEALAVLPSPDLARRLEAIARDTRADLRVRQTALWTLGRTGKQQAAGVLVAFLGENEEMRRIALSCLTDLTGLGHSDTKRWKAWWDRAKRFSTEQWLEMRLGFQARRAGRLEGDLVRARAQVLRLQQTLYSRLPVAERFAHVRLLCEDSDPSVRALALAFALELLPAAPPAELDALSRSVTRLTRDGNPEVQRAAVLALGRMAGNESFARLKELLGHGTPAVRMAAARAMGGLARGSTPEARTRQKQVIPLLQKALDDTAIEVVVEAAEALGALGAAEAGPVLTCLLRHSSSHVRQTAAQALERTADAGLARGLLEGLDDAAASVRFCLVGAIGRAMVGRVSAATRKQLLARLETVLARDADVGVRGRAASVLGECGGTEQLDPLWKAAQAASEGRVQEKAWEAMGDVLARLGDIKTAESWDAELIRKKQATRRVQLWARMYARLEAKPEHKEKATQALEGLVRAQVDQGRWAAAAPLAQSLLTRCPETGEARQRCLRLLLLIAEQALADGDRAEALRLATEARSQVKKAGLLAEQLDAVKAKAAKPTSP